MAKNHISRAACILLVLGLLTPPEPSAAQAASGVIGTRANAEPLDLNTAEASQLQQLPGMGAIYAKRILEGRPYSSKNQLLSRGILPQAAYERIKDDVVAHRVKPAAANDLSPAKP